MLPCIFRRSPTLAAGRCRELRESALHARQVVRTIADDWRVTSYSGLQQHGQSIAQDLMPKLDVDAAGAGSVPVEPVLTPHQFPRGASPGTFLHSLFRRAGFYPAGFRRVGAENVTERRLRRTAAAGSHRLDRAVLHAPLTTQGISLSQLTAKDKQVEMEVYFPIASPLRAEALDALIREARSLSAGCPPLNFRQVQGMLKGFIDLVFRQPGALRRRITNRTGWGQTAKLIPTGDGLSDANASLRSAVSALQSGAAPLPASSHGRLPL